MKSLESTWQWPGLDRARNCLPKKLCHLPNVSLFLLSNSITSSIVCEPLPDFITRNPLKHSWFNLSYKLPSSLNPVVKLWNASDDIFNLFLNVSRFQCLRCSTEFSSVFKSSQQPDERSILPYLSRTFNFRWTLSQRLQKSGSCPLKSSLEEQNWNQLEYLWSVSF